MRRILFNTIICTISIFVLSSCNHSNQETALRAKGKIPFKLTFKLKKNIGKLLDENQFSASVEFININHDTLEIFPRLYFGMKGRSEAFYIEAFDLENNEIDITTNIDYQYLSHDKPIIFSNGDIIKDTFNSDWKYKFKEKGTYKLRFAFNPEDYHYKKGNLISEKIYSNWDTLVIE